MTLRIWLLALIFHFLLFNIKHHRFILMYTEFKFFTHMRNPMTETLFINARYVNRYLLRLI